MTLHICVLYQSDLLISVVFWTPYESSLRTSLPNSAECRLFAATHLVPHTSTVLSLLHRWVLLHCPIYYHITECSRHIRRRNRALRLVKRNRSHLEYLQGVMPCQWQYWND
jgi:hypothetical protein